MLSLFRRPALAAVMIATAGLSMPSRAPAQDQAAGAPAPQGNQETLESRACLIMGYDLVAQYRQIGVPLDIEAIIQGIRLAAEDKPMPIPEQQCQEIVESFNVIVRKRMDALMQQQDAAMSGQAEANLKAGNEYLEKNRSVPGVQVYESGVQHRVIRAGTGPSPVFGETVRLHYTGRLVDGSKFDSSVGRDPAVFTVGGVIDGMNEVLQKMKVGEKCEMVIPAHLAYGMRAPDVIGPNQVLIFEVELLEIVK